MAKTVYVGHIRNELYETKTLVVAENAEDARAKVLEKLSNHLGTLYQEQDLQIPLCKKLFIFLSLRQHFGRLWGQSGELLGPGRHNRRLNRFHVSSPFGGREGGDSCDLWL